MDSSPYNSPYNPQKTWDAIAYQGSHSYIWQYGASLIKLLQPKPDERILDLGCGTGQLAAEIANSGATVLGVDSSVQMLKMARTNYPKLTFKKAEAQNLHFHKSFDAIFSNAVLHWVKDQEKAVASIAKSLKVGGRLVVEMGGKGNVKSVIGALREAINKEVKEENTPNDPWYFPTIGEYTTLLEKYGLEVKYASHFDRPTPLKRGPDGLSDWIKMFASDLLINLTDTQQARVLLHVVNILKTTHFQGNRWVVDYSRLRVEAFKIIDV